MEQKNDINNIENNINNNNQNFNNQNINGNNENSNFNFINQFKNVTISFLIFFIINIIIYFYSKTIPLEINKYVFQYSPIIKKSQLYRIITRYFIHFGICHLILELIIFFYLCKLLENLFGTLFTLSLIFISMILDSIIQLLIIPIFLIFMRGRFANLYNYLYEGGLTPIVFTLLTYFSLYRKNRNEQITFEFLFILRAKYSYIYLLGALYFFTPNRTFFGNISGIIGGYVLKNYPNYILPKIKWIKEIEDYYSLNKTKLIYKYIDLTNKKMKQILIEYDRNSIEDIIGNYNLEDLDEVGP